MHRLIVLVFLFSFAITKSIAGDFKKVDKYARSVRKSGNYIQLTKKLTTPFAGEEDKVRAIYVWITDNIRYDWIKFQKNLRSGGRKYRIHGKSKTDLMIKKQKIRQKKINNTYRSGKGVCEDYSRLFQAMCQSIGIKSIVINGNTRVSPNHIGSFPSRSNHAWNAVYINGKWYLVDATWGAGYVKSGRFHKKFEDDFFMTDPSIFILSHFPDNPKWQLLKRPVSKKEFSSFAYLHSAFYEYDVIDFSPKNAYLSAKKKFAVITIKFSKTPPDIYQYKHGKLKNLDFIKNGNEIQIKIPTLAKYHRNVKLVLKNGKKALPLLEYKIK